MEWIAILLVLASAVLHAGWNLLGKMQVNPNLHFFIMATLMASITLSLGLITTWEILISLPYIPLILFSGCFQVLYLAGLAKSYQHFELSVAYPIVRALPVILVPIIGIVLSSVSRYEILLRTKDWVAYIVIILGTLLLIPKRSGFSILHFRFLLIAALGTTGYSITDHFIQRQWGEAAPNSPFILGYLYILLQGWATVAIGIIYLTIFKKNRIFRKAPNWKIWLQAGLIISASYFLILVAMVFVPNASDVVAFRQISIPIGFVLGIAIMKEKIDLRKSISVLTICIGLLIIGL